MKKFNKYLKKFRQSINKYALTNRLFISYFIFSIIGCILVREVTLHEAITLKAMSAELGIILLIGSLGYFVKPKNQYKYYFFWIVVFTLIEIVNSVYYTFYASFASLSELASLKQAETVTDSIFGELRLIDFVYVLFPFLFYYIHKNLNKTPYYNLMAKVENGKKMVIGTIIVSLIFLGYTFITATKTDYSRLSKQWNRSYVVERFGVLIYQANDVFQTLKPRISSLFGYDEALQVFNDYFNDEENLKYNKDNKYTGLIEGDNIVYIHMESLQTFLMDLSFNNKAVTPNLNALAKEGMFFSNFYPQISTGTSSDAEYIMLSGLLPSSSGPVFVSYSDNKFITLASLLKDKGYYTFSMHGNYASMWNRNNVHPRLGYDNMFFKESFVYNEDVDTVGLGINDKMFFSQAVDKLKAIEKENKNYFGTLITLSNHSPFKKDERFLYDLSVTYKDETTKEEVTTCYLCDTDIGDYIVSSNYADEALGEFINYIKSSSEFNNTVFVFYGDHDAKFSRKDLNYLYNYDYKTGSLKTKEDPTYVEYDAYQHNLSKKTPLIIWSKNSRLKNKLKGEIKNVMGMYDVMPTLLNMLDIDYKYTLGHDIFNIKDNNIVVFPNGNYLTNKVYYNNASEEYKVISDNVTLDENYITSNAIYTEKALEIGNAIIMYDLLKTIKGE